LRERDWSEWANRHNLGGSTARGKGLGGARAKTADNLGDEEGSREKGELKRLVIKNGETKTFSLQRGVFGKKEGENRLGMIKRGQTKSTSW